MLVNQVFKFNLCLIVDNFRNMWKKNRCFYCFCFLYKKGQIINLTYYNF